MHELIAALQDHAIELICTGLMGTVTVMIRNMVKALKKMQKDNQAEKHGLQSLLRDRLLQSYKYCKNRGYIDYDEKESWLNMYNDYHTLGKNGVMDGVKEEVQRLPLQAKEDNA